MPNLLCMKKSAAATHRILPEVYGGFAPTNQSRREWVRGFKSSGLSVEGKECPDQLRKFKAEKLEALLNQDPCQPGETVNAKRYLLQQISLRGVLRGKRKTEGNKRKA